MQTPSQALRLITLIIVISFSGCSSHHRVASSEPQLQTLLSDAFLKGDISVVGSLIHPATDPNITKGMMALISTWFKVTPEKVTPSIIQLSEVPFHILGELDGRKLKYTSPVSGVVHLAGRSNGEHGEVEYDIYFPYTETKDGYCLADVTYEQ